MTVFLCLGYPDNILYQVGMVVQSAIIDGSESSCRFSSKEESFARDLRAFGVAKLPAHCSTKSELEDIKETNSASKNI